MTTTEERILDKLDQIVERTAKLEERVTGLSDRIDKYNNVTGRIVSIEKQISLQEQACKTVQDQKKTQSIPTGSLKASIITGVTVGLIMLIVNFVVNSL